MEFTFDPEKLKQEQDDAASQKKWLALAGGIGDALSSQQSFGNFFTGKMNAPSTTVSKVAGAAADSIQDPVERQAKLFGAYKQSQEAKQLQDQEATLARKKDPNSRESMALKALAPRWGIQVTNEMSAHDIEQMIDPRKMMETEAQSRVNFDNDMAKLRYSRAADRDKYQMEMDLRRQQKAEDEQKKLNEDRRERETTFGVARTKDDAKKLKDASEMKSKLDAQISELISIRKAKGAEMWDRDSVARAKQLSKDLLLTKKNLENLGVLSQSDRDIVDEIIPSDPTQFNFAQLVGQDPTLTKLEAFKTDTNRDFEERLKNRIEGYTPKPIADVPPGQSPQDLARAELERRRAAQKTAGRK